MSDGKKPYLPYGWVVHQSKTFPDRIYYYNTKTRVSSWTCPELIKADCSQQKRPKIPVPASLSDSSVAFSRKNSKTEKKKKPVLSPKCSPTNEKLCVSATSPPCVSSTSEVVFAIGQSNVNNSESGPTTNKMPRRKIVRPNLSSSGTKSDVKTDARYKPYNVAKPNVVKTNMAEKVNKFSNNTAKKSCTEKTVAQLPKPISPTKTQPKVISTTATTTTTKNPLLNSTVNRIQQLERDIKVAIRRNRFSLPNKVIEEKVPPLKTRTSLSPSFATGNKNKTDETCQEATSTDLPDCSTDVEMLDLSYDTPEPSPSKNYFIIVDTNVLIANLKFVDELKDSPLEGCGPPMIVVPWVVLQELDRIKNGKERNDTVLRANEAVRYIHGMWSAKHPRICGQNSWENLRELEGSLDPNCNDDMILHCCLQFFKKVPREKVILLSNDKNLCNKAMVHDLLAYSSDTILQHLKVDFSPTTSAPAYAMSCNISTPTEFKEGDEKLRIEVDRLMMLGKSLIKNCLGEFLETEMIAAYKDEIWLTVVHRKPPWSLLDILECMNKHWISVFTFVMSRDTKKYIEKLRSSLRTTKGYICDEKQALDFVSNGLSLCTDVAKRGSATSKDTVEKLIPLHQQLLCLGKNNSHKGTNSDNNNNKKSPGLPQSHLRLSNGDSSHMMSSNIEINGRVKQLLQHVWYILNHLCGTVLDALGWPHKLEYQKPPTLPSKEETNKFIPILYPELQKLRKHMTGVVSNKDEKLSTDNIKGFFQQLHKILPTLNVQELLPVSISEEEFRGFCTDNENKEILQAGLKQLNLIFTMVHKSIVGTAKQQ